MLTENGYSFTENELVFLSEMTNLIAGEYQKKTLGRKLSEGGVDNGS